MVSGNLEMEKQQLRFFPELRWVAGRTGGVVWELILATPAGGGHDRPADQPDC